MYQVFIINTRRDWIYSEAHTLEKSWGEKDEQREGEREGGERKGEREGVSEIVSGRGRK